MANMEQNSLLNDYMLKHRRLAFEFSITGHATPASKVHAVDLPGIAVLSSEGKTADAQAVEAVTFTTNVDATNAVIGMILKGSELGSIAKVKQITVQELTALGSAAPSVTKHGTRGLTSGGNIAFSVTTTGLALDSESPRMLCIVEYQLAE